LIFPNTPDFPSTETSISAYLNFCKSTALLSFNH